MVDDRRQPLQGAPACCGRTGWQSRHEPHKRGLNTKIHLAVDAHGMPLRVVVTEGTRADCAKAGELIEGFEAGHLIADRGYDSEAIVEKAKAQGIRCVIPPRRNRRQLREYDRALYRAASPG
jgi:transposase